MRWRTWPVAALGLGALLLLVVLSVLAASRRAQEIVTQLDQLNTHHRDVDAKLRRLRSDVQQSGIFVRDYLLDTERARAAEYRQQLAEFRRSNIDTVRQLQALARRSGANPQPIDSLQSKLDEYWEAFDPLIDWTPAEKIFRSAGFLRREVLPRREAVLTIAQQIEELNNANLATQRAEITRRYAVFRTDLHKLLWQSILLGVFVALTAVIRLRVLERRSEEQREAAEQAEEEMRRLSQQLVATQEEERRKLSRELHDHVGQMLTGLRMELGRIDRLRVAADDQIGVAVAECRRIVDEMVYTVRDLALGLRPSMLDDFGLVPALEWHVRDFRRRYGLDVDLNVAGSFDRLPDRYSTCVYRAVQEALTNCIRHASAGRIEIVVRGTAGEITLSVADDGVGFNPRAPRHGLGLRGIEERVRELGGATAIRSAAGRGTTLSLRLPLPVKQEAAVAGVAG